MPDLHSFPIIPLPVQIKAQADSAQIYPGVPIYYTEKELATTAEFLKEVIQKLTGQAPAVNFMKNMPETAGPIILSLDPKIAQPEGYQLIVGSSIRITGQNACGVFYGMQTLRQLLRAHCKDSDTISIPGCTIYDYPRFPWRGMHLDVSRHFFDTAFIKKYIDIIALHKMNTFHWHLVDDQGWRIEIKKYPKLTEIGAWRVDRENLHWEERPEQQPGEKATYGGYYTQDEIRELVDYAAQRFITVIPEIEMPAHVQSALAAYPEFSCQGEPLSVLPGGVWPITNIYCAGNEATFEFLENILSEVMALFPSKRIHIGGDEANKTEWRKCPKCQQRIKDEGLKDEKELQSYFIQRVEKFLNANGRILIGWDEILEGGLAENAVVMSWRGIKGGIQAAKMEHPVVMTPDPYCYFNYHQSRDKEIEPVAIGGFTDLQKVYSYEPIPVELTKNEAQYILGAQGNLWTEYIPTGSLLEYMALPRMTALAEVVWTPPALKNETDFLKRLECFLNMLAEHGINYYLPAPQGLFKKMVFIDSGNVELNNLFTFGEIRYTLDGSEPGTNSLLYTQPILISENTEIKAALFLKNGRQSLVKTGKLMQQTPHATKKVDEKALASGLIYDYFEGIITTVEDIDSLTLKHSGKINCITLPAGITDAPFALKINGFIRVPATGVYTFGLYSNDGSRLFIDDECVVDNDGLHTFEGQAGQIALEAGYHVLKVLYFENGGSEGLEARVIGPGIEEMVVPAEWFFSIQQ